MNGKKIKIAGIDPSLTHTGIAIAELDLETMKFEVVKVFMAETAKDNSKNIRRNSDDLRRAAIMADLIYEHTSDCVAVFAEIPTGAQSARAALAFGVVIGLLAGITRCSAYKPAFIQVTPSEVKISIPEGSKNTSKEEIIEWAVTSWPTIGWDKVQKGSKFQFPSLGLKLGQHIEHPADACAAINAGIKTDAFRNIAAIFAAHR